jgi:hypothetical protein
MSAPDSGDEMIMNTSRAAGCGLCAGRGDLRRPLTAGRSCYLGAGHSAALVIAAR